MRYLCNKNFVGIIFTICLENNKSELSLTEINDTYDELFSKLHYNNTVVDYTTNDLYGFLEDYSYLFTLNKDSINLTKKATDSYNLNKKDFLNSLNYYFVAGISKDIVNIIKNYILQK